MSRVSATVSAVRDFFVSTAFRHRATAVVLPAALAAINEIQAQFSDFSPNTSEKVVIATVVYAVLGWARGKVSPA